MGSIRGCTIRSGRYEMHLFRQSIDLLGACQETVIKATKADAVQYATPLQ